jgi:hypothetical protein
MSVPHKLFHLNEGFAHPSTLDYYDTLLFGGKKREKNRTRQNEDTTVSGTKYLPRYRVPRNESE